MERVEPIAESETTRPLLFDCDWTGIRISYGECTLSRPLMRNSRIGYVIVAGESIYGVTRLLEATLKLEIFHA